MSISGKPEEEFLELENGKLRIRRKGEGRPLLFLHGAHGMTSWLPFLDELATRFEVIAPDHPGFGQSESSSSMDNIADLARVYLELIDRLGGIKPHVVGHCIGGWIGMEIALRSPLVSSLTLINSAGIHADAQKGDFFMCPPDELPDLMFSDAAFGRRYFEEEKAADDEVQYRNRVMAAKLAWHPRLFDPHLHKWFCRIKIPLQIIWGEENRVLPKQFGDMYSLALGRPLTLIPEAGHLAHVERAAECARHVQLFIEH
ncbi:MAG: alpha/beta fold hydrolase [Betaproteobacteria bacterium]|nr:alpha/beta fold hydrolase [Betaproteobacteria bacterium]